MELWQCHTAALLVCERESSYRGPEATLRMMALLPLLVLCALSSVCTPVQGEVKAIKLCGRGFIRAIVYTCGGSRWRRILNEPALPGVGSLTQDSFEFLSTSAPAPRHRRDLNEKLMIMCCQVGCRKSDLVFFC